MRANDLELAVDAFFERLGDTRYRATELTRGPWDPRAQHAGPSSALVAGELEAATGGFLARVTLEILRPIPITTLTVSTEVVRPGRSVRLAEAALSDDEGPIVLARGWAIEPRELTLPDAVAHRRRPDTRPDDGAVRDFFDTGAQVGYHTAMDVRFIRGGFRDLGPSFAWMRARVPIVDGEAIRPIQRVMVAADSGNGISATLPWQQWLFINTDLTVALHRHPTGSWVAMDGETSVEPHGVGLARTLLYDEEGPIGRGLQTLMVAPR